MKTFRDAERGETLEAELNHNFEADMYLEKLEQDEKVKLRKPIVFFLNIISFRSN